MDELKVKITRQLIENEFIDTAEKLMLMKLYDTTFYEGTSIVFYKTNLDGKYLMVYGSQNNEEGPDFYEKICCIKEVQRILLSVIANGYILRPRTVYTSNVDLDEIKGTINITKDNYRVPSIKGDFETEIGLVNADTGEIEIYICVKDESPFDDEFQIIFKNLREEREFSIYI